MPAEDLSPGLRQWIVDNQDDLRRRYKVWVGGGGVGSGGRMTVVIPDDVEPEVLAEYAAHLGASDERGASTSGKGGRPPEASVDVVAEIDAELDHYVRGENSSYEAIAQRVTARTGFRVTKSRVGRRYRERKRNG